MHICKYPSIYLYIVYNVIFHFTQHLEVHKKDLVPKNHPAYRRLIRVIEKIFTANKDLKSMRDTQWTLTVINTPLTNSYILPVHTFNVIQQYIQHKLFLLYFFCFLSRVEISLYL